MKNFKKRREEILKSPEYKEMLERNKYEGKIRALYMVVLVPLSFILSYLTEVFLEIDNKSPTWIFGILSILASLFIANQKASKKYSNKESK